MARILVTGSSQGIGLQTARDLIALGQEVTAHARNDERARDAAAVLDGVAGIAVGDLSSLSSTRAMGERLAEQAPFDVVVHNAGVGGAPAQAVTEDGLSEVFQVNVLGPYVLSALLARPGRAIYLSSGLESAGVARFDDLQWEKRAWDGSQAYSDSKLYDVMLALWVARHWPSTVSNAVDPGWIRTNMGGPDAQDDLPEGAETQVWLAHSDEPAALESGRYIKRRRALRPNPAATDPAQQEELVAACAKLSGITLER